MRESPEDRQAAPETAEFLLVGVKRTAGRLQASPDAPVEAGRGAVASPAAAASPREKEATPVPAAGRLRASHAAAGRQKTILAAADCLRLRRETRPEE